MAMSFLAGSDGTSVPISLAFSQVSVQILVKYASEHAVSKSQNVDV
jgi:hypothetical protein